MPKSLGFVSADNAQGAAVFDQGRSLDTAEADGPLTGRSDAALLAATDRDQLARDIAAIERAAAALCRAEPALQSWTNPPAPTLQNARPVWLLIGVLWVSTALVTLGAVYAISALVG